MMDLQELIKTAAVPSLILAVYVFLTGSLKDPLRTRVQASGWGAGLALGFYLLKSQLNFPPFDLAQSFFCTSLALILYIWVRPNPRGPRYVVRAIFVVAIGALTLWPMFDRLAGPVNLRNLLAFFFLGLGVWSICERSVRSVQLPALVALPMLTVGTLCLFLLHKGSAVLPPVCATVCALQAAVLAVSLVAPGKVAQNAVVPFVSVLVIALLASAHFYLHINPWTMIYLCIPFAVIWLRPWIPFVPGPAALEMFVLLAISLIPLSYLMLNTYHLSV